MRMPSLKGAEITPRFLLPWCVDILGLNLPQKHHHNLFPKVRPFLCFGKEKEWSEKNYSILSSHGLTDRTAMLYTPSLPHLYIFPEDCAGGACKGFAGRKPGPGTAALRDRHSTGRWQPPQSYGRHHNCSHPFHTDLRCTA